MNPGRSDEQSTIKKSTIGYLSALPEFLLHPRRTIAPWLDKENPITDAIKLAGAMLAIGAGAAAAIKLGHTIEASSISFITAGTVAIWMIYGLFLHVFAYIAGARRGFRYTVTAYLYVIGFLQPVLVAILWGIVWLLPGAVSYREITVGLGGSGAMGVLTSGNFVSADAAVIYRFLSGALILTYFAACLATAQRISLVRSSFAAIASCLFFFIVFLIMNLISQVGLDAGFFKRLSFG